MNRPAVPSKITSEPVVQLAGGHYFNVLDPEGSHWTIEDIAHALSNTCRFGGHVRKFYSVAQHSAIVSQIVPPEDALAGLLHDAAEAIVGDLPTPIKQLLPEFSEIEYRIAAAIFRAHGLPEQLPDSVKRADRVALATERRDLMPTDGVAWEVLDGITPLSVTIAPLPPESAKALFLAQYDHLTGGVRQAAANPA